MTLRAEIQAAAQTAQSDVALQRLSRPLTDDEHRRIAAALAALPHLRAALDALDAAASGGPLRGL